MTVRVLLVGGLSAAVSAAWLRAQAPEAAILTPTPPSASSSPGASQGPKTYVGSTVCAQCHFNRFESYQNSPHSFKGDPRTPASRLECETCHGPGSAHVEGGGGRTVGGMRNFGAAMPPEAKNAVCLECHTRGPVALWAGSTHADRKLACTSCHQIHGGNAKLLAQPSQPQLCTQCHQQIRSALMKPSHHPIREEKMVCTSCHNPHGTQTDKLIAANSVNEKCLECHAEKRGPFLWEHPPVRESCLNCHDPHGTSHEPMLLARKPQLCQRCHSNVRHPGTLYALSPQDRASGRSVYSADSQLLYRSCTNCHVMVHGSNHPSGKWFHR